GPRSRISETEILLVVIDCNAVMADQHDVWPAVHVVVNHGGATAHYLDKRERVLPTIVPPIIETGAFGNIGKMEWRDHRGLRRGMRGFNRRRRWPQRVRSRPSCRNYGKRQNCEVLALQRSHSGAPMPESG